MAPDQQFDIEVKRPSKEIKLTMKEIFEGNECADGSITEMTVKISTWKAEQLIAALGKAVKFAKTDPENLKLVV